ncbi:gastric triacylglycerol lipase-like isoform X1 [Podarcis muralis]
MPWASILICLVYGSALAHGLIGDRSVDYEATLNAKSLIEYWEYPAEEHDVTTDDGYILTIFRIPHGRADRPDPGARPRPVVFLQHGLLVDAANWFQNLPHNSLAFMLADAGYDVWLGNSRGNSWSRRHHFLSPRSVEFWEFSFDQMAKYDLPASIDYVLQKTGQKQLFYIGHSQGTTMAFIAFSTNPRLAAKIKLYIALAPVATVKYAKTPLAKLSLLHEVQIKAMFGMKEFLPKTFFGSLVAAEFCSRNLLAPICGNLLFMLCGFNEKNLNLSRIDVYAAQVPSGTSVQNIIHWKQSILAGKLQAYDYGLFDNLARYGKVEPPEYNIRNMNVTTIVWSSGKDWLSGPEDVNMLIPKIKNLLYHEYIPEWNHLDFVFGLDAADRMYYKIIENLKENL